LLRKTVPEITLTVLLIDTLTLAFGVQPVESSGSIYIRADGSIEPTTANIASFGNATYYCTHDNYDEIVVERSNIIIDGVTYYDRNWKQSKLGRVPVSSEYIQV
jgi:hypothetical protein